MTNIYNTWLPLLLADSSPCLRLLVLKELLGKKDDDKEVRELAVLREEDPLVIDLLKFQKDNGAWSADGRIWQGNAFRATYLALMRLGYLGFDRSHPAVRRGAEFLYASQKADGSWPLPKGGVEGEENEGYSMIPLQTALPLRALAMCGYGEDPRSEKAYEWLLSKRLDEGSWPAGFAGGKQGENVYGYIAGYRKLPRSRWGCRSNTTGSLLCLAHHPVRCKEQPAKTALDLLLGRETREVRQVGFETARLIGTEPVRGFFTFYARFDLALLLDLCWRIGATISDQRVADLTTFIEGLRSQTDSGYGIWTYGPKPQASRWITFDILRSLSGLSPEGSWIGTDLGTPFQAYPKRKKRF